MEQNEKIVDVERNVQRGRKKALAQLQLGLYEANENVCVMKVYDNAGVMVLR